MSKSSRVFGISSSPERDVSPDTLFGASPPPDDDGCGVANTRFDGAPVYQVPTVLSWRYHMGLLLVMWFAMAPSVWSQTPFADVHVHFNWDQEEIISADEVVAKIKAAGVAFAVVASTPTVLALDLKRAGGDLIVPLFSPYIHELGIRDWYREPKVLELAEAGLANGLYRGVGEIHFMVGFKPRPDNPIFLKLLELAKQYDVPALIHVDAGSEKMFVGICRQHPDLRILFAHAGGRLYASHVRRVIERCGNVTVEFSARDPWRYGGLTGDDGLLLPEWRKLVLDYPERFVVGRRVQRNQRQSIPGCRSGCPSWPICTTGLSEWARPRRYLRWVPRTASGSGAVISCSSGMASLLGRR